MPIDEERDAILIRDEWVRQKLKNRKEEYSEERQLRLVPIFWITAFLKNVYRLRIGTFNVNGKLPSQNLSSWLFGSSGGQIAIAGSTIAENQAFKDAISKHSSLMPQSPNPPSIVSTPASEKLPVEHQPYPISDSSSIVTSAASSSLTLDALDNETLGPSSPPTSTPSLPEEYSDLPDLFILGFQEVDLSTESLIYRTSSAREEAWGAAIFEALGKFADQYIKVNRAQMKNQYIEVYVVFDSLVNFKAACRCPHYCCRS